MIKKLAVLVFLLATSPLWAQYTTVTATITDPNGNPYANGLVTAALTARQPFNNTQNFPPNTAVAKLDTTGSFTLSLVDNTQQASPQPQWVFTICAVDGKTCFSSTQTISGTSQSLSTTLSALAPPYFSLGVPTGMPMVYYRQVSATQTGSIAPVTMLTPTTTTQFLIHFHLDQIGAGNTCTTNTTIAAQVVYTDPVASSPTTATVVTFTITTNGTANVPVLSPSAALEQLAAKANTAIQFQTTFTGGSCVTTPTYQITAVLEVL